MERKMMLARAKRTRQTMVSNFFENMGTAGTEP
jgi:hypothetical protein